MQTLQAAAGLVDGLRYVDDLELINADVVGGTANARDDVVEILM